MPTSERRFPLERSAQLRVGSGSCVREAVGRTSELSRRHLELRTDLEAVAGEAVEALVNLGDDVGAGADILLHIRGVVTFAGDGRIDVQIQQHRLGTRAAKAASS